MFASSLCRGRLLAAGGAARRVASAGGRINGTSGPEEKGRRAECWAAQCAGADPGTLGERHFASDPVQKPRPCSPICVTERAARTYSWVAVVFFGRCRRRCGKRNDCPPMWVAAYRKGLRRGFDCPPLVSVWTCVLSWTRVFRFGCVASVQCSLRVPIHVSSSLFRIASGIASACSIHGSKANDVRGEAGIWPHFIIFQPVLRSATNSRKVGSVLRSIIC